MIYFIRKYKQKTTEELKELLTDLTGRELQAVKAILMSRSHAKIKEEVSAKKTKPARQKEVSAKKTTENDGRVFKKEKKLKFLQDLIEREDKKNPLTDKIMTLLFQNKGYKTSVHSIKKYRQQMNIPCCYLRKRYDDINLKAGDTIKFTPSNSSRHNNKGELTGVILRLRKKSSNNSIHAIIMHKKFGLFLKRIK